MGYSKQKFDSLVLFGLVWFIWFVYQYFMEYLKPKFNDLDRFGLVLIGLICLTAYKHLMSHWKPKYNSLVWFGLVYWLKSILARYGLFIAEIWKFGLVRFSLVRFDLFNGISALYLKLKFDGLV